MTIRATRTGAITNGGRGGPPRPVGEGHGGLMVWDVAFSTSLGGFRGMYGSSFVSTVLRGWFPCRGTVLRGLLSNY